MIQQYNVIQQARRRMCDLPSPENRQDYRRFFKAYKTAEEALSRLRETLTEEQEHLFTNDHYLLTLIDDLATSNESSNAHLTSRLNEVRADQMVNDELLVALSEADAAIQEHYEEGVAAYGSLRRAKRKQPLAFVAGGLAGIVLATGITGAALVHHYESRPTPPMKTRIETRYVDSTAPVPKKLEEHLEGIKFGIGEPLVIIDPARQEERVYRVALVEQMRHAVSTGRIPGAKRSGGDNRTPEVPPGEYFVVTMVEPSTTWKRHDRYAFGPWFARIDTLDSKLAKWGLTKKGSSIGLHGTDEPDYLGTRRSEGCIRHADEVIVQMKDEGILEEGTKIVINTGILGDI